LKDTTADEETGSVGGGVVGQTARDTISWQLMGVSSTDDNVTLEASVGDLGNDVLVCDTDYKSVFWGVVFVLVLNTKTLAGEIVGFTFTSSSELDLVSLEVGLVLLNGNESLLSSTSSFGRGLSFDPNRSVRRSKSDSKMG